MEFSTDKKSTQGINPVNLVIDYQNPDGSFQRQVETLGVRVQGPGADWISPRSPRILPGSRKETSSPCLSGLKIPVPMMPNPSMPKSISRYPGTKEAFVGKIEPNNDAPAPFNLQADRSGDLPYTLTIQYEDEYGPRQEQQDLHLNVYDYEQYLH